MAIGEKEVIEYICAGDNYWDLQKQSYDLRQKIQTMEKQYDRLQDEIISSVQTSNHMSERSGSGSRQPEDLYHVLIQSEMLLKDQINDMYIKHKLITNEIEREHRLKLVWDIVSADCRDLLVRLYRNHEKWDFLEHELKISRTQIARLRGQTLKMIINLYNSTVTNQQLAKMKTKSSRSLVQNQKNEEKDNRQLSLLDYQTGGTL